MGKPMTHRELREYAAGHGGLNSVRVITAFARQQGTREDGTAIWRRIDNAKSGGQNGARAAWETSCACSRKAKNAIASNPAPPRK
jgi:hypothetical protein